MKITKDTNKKSRQNNIPIDGKKYKLRNLDISVANHNFTEIKEVIFFLYRIESIVKKSKKLKDVYGKDTWRRQRRRRLKLGLLHDVVVYHSSHEHSDPSSRLDRCCNRHRQ